ncbi:hypothetical protein A3A76_02600 [Candidatus Woesebacteria bacterium RIFCSPLOWO2_01_FULL_39_23]|uniref:Uncharacterized protein n=1 Tax=Candidatus Woesebacteria bacterium RIFCSPHIGHO2_01_FULL_40_22 TaxID=1802499 RepID=A0A1F7YJ45_9BACT|nr:MAG: hypothetical protein A2141_01430 [Candidatus Woesebacteria bacterium RBG_16_40_11]OGM27366.1 MAG: hypothetical protein A2628_01005 [Candidatus Woesebacteria bacterium RIFCSPHIGHO2_01_FULL_40_22]OGM37257.1 MAG: hypothetical protein A3E41_00215 [Candidatus Woesebacteria bacterium RIFCSPHIGHO2_12_FULL_38_9]OGM62538.1 MAG: hypothetical protein A3A76_02600 [Candidatus Woesebacteria bacterium RIFCSPLOWO2_01_FULL_39_23]
MSTDRLRTSGLSTRDFLKISAAASLAATGLYLSNENNKIGFNKIFDFIVKLSHDSNAIELQRSDYLKIYYPLSRELPIKQDGVIDSGISDTDWFNYTNLRINSVSFQKLIQFYEKLAVDGKQYEYNFNNGAVDLSHKFRIGLKSERKHTCVITSDINPTPDWTMGLKTATVNMLLKSKENEDIIPGRTMTIVSVPSNIENYPKVEVNKNLKSIVSTSMATEAFNMTSYVNSDLQENYTGKTEAGYQGDFAGEITANSIGLMFVAKQLGLNYKQFEDSIIEKDGNIRYIKLGFSYIINGKRILATPFMDKDMYNKIPNIGLPIS